MASNETWTVQRILAWTTGYLERKGDEHPRLSAEWLLSNATGLTRVELYMSFDKPLTMEERDFMRDAVRRRGEGEPLQYVTGEMPFRHIVLRCERGVLIPRPETEVLVDVALEALDAAIARGDAYDDAELHAKRREEDAEATQASDDSVSVSAASALSTGVPDAAAPGVPTDVSNVAYTSAPNPFAWGSAVVPDSTSSGTNSNADSDPDNPDLDSGSADASDFVEPEPREPLPSGPRVLEIGTGTGCIALSIASERRGTSVWATDLSDQAFELSRRNRDALNLEDFVRIRKCDLATDVPADLMGTFSVLVSNPPYIPSAVVPTLPMEVQGFEPSLALDGGADGLDVFRRILELAPFVLAPGGALVVELFEDNVHAAADLVRAQPGWAHVEVREDLTHRPRVLFATRELEAKG